MLPTMNGGEQALTIDRCLWWCMGNGVCLHFRISRTAIKGDHAADLGIFQEYRLSAQAPGHRASAPGAQKNYGRPECRGHRLRRGP